VKKTIISGVVLFLLTAGFLLSAAAKIENGPEPLKGKWDFKPEKQWELTNAGDMELVSVRFIHSDEKGNLFVLDEKHVKFFVFDAAGKFLYAFGKKGEGPGEMRMPGGFYLRGKYVIVSDWGMIHYFTRDGNYVRSHNTGGNFWPKTFIDENHFVTIRALEDPGSQKDTELLELYDTRDGSRKTIAEVTAEKMLQAQSGGMQLQIKDAMVNPVVVVGFNGKDLFFGKNDSYLINRSDLQGNIKNIFSVTGKERRKITDDLKRKRFEQISLNGGKMPEEMIKRMMKQMPDQCTYYGEIKVDRKGLIYISINDMNPANGQEMDIFSADGKYLYNTKLVLPDGLTASSRYDLDGDTLTVFAEDEDGERKLVKYKITTPSI